jgi:small subunit ribosomal protein S1
MSNDSFKDDFASLFEAQADKNTAKLRPLSPGEHVTGTVIQVGRDQVFVEVAGRGGLGRGLQAYFHSADLRGPDGQVAVKPGDTLEGMVVELDSGGAARLGRSAGRPAGLQALTNAHSSGVPVEGKVTGVNKGGLEVDIGGSSAFCPMSQIERGFVADPSTYIGRTLTFKVTELRDGGKRVVLSRRAALEAEAKQKAVATLAALQVGVGGARLRCVRRSGWHRGPYPELGALA